MEARALFERAVAVNRKDALAFRGWSRALAATGRISEAMAVLKDGLAANPSSSTLTMELAQLCIEAGRTAEARRLFAISAARDLESRSLIGLFSAIVTDGERWQDWRREYGWLPIDPGADESVYAGRALIAAGFLRAAADCFRSVLQKDPCNPEAMCACGDIAAASGDFENAITSHEQAIMLDPGNPAAHVALFLDHLGLRKFGIARRIYEERASIIRANWGHGLHFSGAGPLWDGASLHGKRILIHCPVGFGDTIQYLRYLPALKSQASELIVSAPSPLIRLIQSSGFADTVVGRFEAIPGALDFECDLREVFIFGQSNSDPMTALAPPDPILQA